jgi:Haem-binding domain
MKRWKRAAIVFAVIIVAVQFVRPGRANPPIETTRTIAAHLGASSAVVAVLDRSCRDCHSNHTVRRWYTQIAPVSWLMAYEVAHGRKAVNFSDWAGYQPEQRRTLLVESCQDARSGKMPGPYPLLRPEARLSTADVDTICGAAQQADAHATPISNVSH